MKTRNLLIATFLVVAATVIALVSCKKETPNAMLGDSAQPGKTFSPPVVDDMNAYLKGFKQKMQESEYSKDGETLGIEEAAWYLSSVANYDFANASVQFTDLRYDTLYYQVSVTNGQIALSDLNAVYESMADDIDAFYQSLDLQEKHFRFIGANVSENGQVMVTMITSYTILEHTYYFGDDWEAYEACSEWFDENTTYVYTDAADLLEQACNFYEGREFCHQQNPPLRTYYVYTRQVDFEYQYYPDQYGCSPFSSNSRIFAVFTEFSVVPSLGFNEMCYCLDSYLDLPFWYVDQNAFMYNERPVLWDVEPLMYKESNNKWYTFCHVLHVKFAQAIETQNPIQY